MVVSTDLVFVQDHLPPRSGQQSCLSLGVSLAMSGAPVSRVQTHRPCVVPICCHFTLQPSCLVTMLVETRHRVPLSMGLQTLLLRLGELSGLLFLECSISPPPRSTMSSPPLA